MLMSNTSGQAASLSCRPAMAFCVIGQTVLQQEKKTETTQTLPRSCSRWTGLPFWSASLKGGSGPSGVCKGSYWSARAAAEPIMIATTATIAARFMSLMLSIHQRGRDRFTRPAHHAVGHQDDNHHHAKDGHRDDEE